MVIQPEKNRDDVFGKIAHLYYTVAEPVKMSNKNMDFVFRKH